MAKLVNQQLPTLDFHLVGIKAMLSKIDALYFEINLRFNFASVINLDILCDRGNFHASF